MEGMTLPRPESLRDSVLVTHKSCLDGSGCAIMFLRSGGKDVKFVAAGMLERFVKDDPLFQSDKFLIFADIGFNSSKYSDVLDKRGNCVLIDHHKTSLHMDGRYWANIDMDACGTELLRRYLKMDFATDKFFANVIDDHDRWIGNIPEGHDLAMLMSFLGQQEFIERFRERCTSNFERMFDSEDLRLVAILKRRRDEFIDEAMKHVRTRDVIICNRAFRIGYVITDDSNTSMLLMELLKRRSDVQVAAQIMMGHEKVSLRSRGDFDVSELAQRFGGGGHAAASGHLITKSLIDDLIGEIHG